MGFDNDFFFGLLMFKFRFMVKIFDIYYGFSGFLYKV